MTTIVAISGSLRTGSSNTAVLQAIAILAPPEVQVVLYSNLSELPHFNPDLDTETPPPAVSEFRSRLLASNGVLISSPEYAHGVPGTLKNALDWLVRSGELYEKPCGAHQRIAAIVARAGISHGDADHHDGQVGS